MIWISAICSANLVTPQNVYHVLHVGTGIYLEM